MDIDRHGRNVSRTVAVIEGNDISVVGVLGMETVYLYIARSIDDEGNVLESDIIAAFENCYTY